MFDTNTFDTLWYDTTTTKDKVALTLVTPYQEYIQVISKINTSFNVSYTVEVTLDTPFNVGSTLAYKLVTPWSQEEAPSDGTAVQVSYKLITPWGHTVPLRIYTAPDEGRVFKIKG